MRTFSKGDVKRRGSIGGTFQYDLRIVLLYVFGVT